MLILTLAVSTPLPSAFTRTLTLITRFTATSNFMYRRPPSEQIGIDQVITPLYCQDDFSAAECSRYLAYAGYGSI